MWIKREFSNKISEALTSKKAIMLTGARQVGKSSLLMRLFPEAQYVTFDDPQTQIFAQDSPVDFLEQFESGSVILDEVQYCPELLRYIKIQIDQKKKVKWILTGSQRFSLMRQASESLAGRLLTLELSTLRFPEVKNLNHRSYELYGGYPEIWSNELLDPHLFFSSYINTYINKDIKQVLSLKDERSFFKFLQSAAVRVGELVNYSGMAREAGVTPATAKSWTEVACSAGLLELLPAFSLNVGKRLSKSPKLYFKDLGLLNYILNIKTKEALNAYPRSGSLWENLCYLEIYEKAKHRDEERNLFYYRDAQKNEVDFVLLRGQKIYLMEAKKSNNPKLTSSLIEVRKVFEDLKYDLDLSIYCRCGSDKIKLKGYSLCNPLK